MAKAASFRFVRVLTPIGFVQIPIARVQLSHGARTVQVDMTIDSGADLTMIPYYVGLSLGMKASQTAVRRLSGISGGAPYILESCKLRLGPFSIRARVAWAQRDDVPALLGRSDVFDRFRITFDERRGSIIFRR